MDPNQRMADLDARITARRDALDKKLGFAPAEEKTAEPEPAAPAGPDGPAPSGPEKSAPASRAAAPAAGKSGDAEGKFAKIMADMDAGLEIPGLFTIPGIFVKIVFVLLCLGAFFSLLWAVRCLLAGWGYGVGWGLGDCIVDAFLAWGLWKLCTRKK